MDVVPKKYRNKIFKEIEKNFPEQLSLFQSEYDQEKQYFKIYVKDKLFDFIISEVSGVYSYAIKSIHWKNYKYEEVNKRATSIEVVVNSTLQDWMSSLKEYFKDMKYELNAEDLWEKHSNKNSILEPDVIFDKQAYGEKLNDTEIKVFKKAIDQSIDETVEENKSIVKKAFEEVKKAAEFVTKTTVGTLIKIKLEELYKQRFLSLENAQKLFSNIIKALQKLIEGV